MSRDVPVNVPLAAVAWAGGMCLAWFASFQPDAWQASAAYLLAFLAIAVAHNVPRFPKSGNAAVAGMAVVVWIVITIALFARFESTLTIEQPDGYLHHSSWLATMGVGVAVFAPMLLLVRVSKEDGVPGRPPTWQLIAATPALLLAVGGPVLSQWLGWGTDTEVTLVVAIIFGLAVSAATTAIGRFLPGRHAQKPMPALVSVGLGLNVVSGLVVGGFLVAVMFPYDRDPGLAALIFAPAIVVSSIAAVILCVCSWVGGQSTPSEASDQVGGSPVRDKGGVA